MEKKIEMDWVKHEVVVELVPSVGEPYLYGHSDAVIALVLIEVANELGLQGLRVTKVVRRQETEVEDRFAAKIHWEANERRGFPLYPC